MADYWIWWILAALLVAAELMTGTFYLLAVGFAFAVGGFTAISGVELPLQLVVAGVVAVAGTIVAFTIGTVSLGTASLAAYVLVTGRENFLLSAISGRRRRHR